jgi:hypothetical protein
MNIIYDMKNIVNGLESTFLAGKAFIESTEEINFVYTNVGNPFAQFDEIISKIPQTRNHIIKLQVSNIGETQRH